ncbi:MAG: ribosome-associated translation inhibitor RaiA [bacterium]|nr:ribosome-associated translation inhibitor RaiA [bacterium]
MKIEFTGRHYHLGERVRQYAERRLVKLAKFLDEPVDVHVILEIEKRRQIAEFHVTHRHGVFQATEESEHMREAINAGVEKIEKQARRSRKKFMDKRRRAQRQDGGHHWPMEVLEAASVGDGAQPRIIKTSRLPIKPMTIDEAVLELDHSKNEFFVFRDSSTDRVSVIYRRKDANYGLIAPDF